MDAVGGWFYVSQVYAFYGLLVAEQKLGSLNMAKTISCAVFIWAALLGLNGPTTVGAQVFSTPCAVVEVETYIDAPYELVFETIVQTDGYPDWNPYILAVTPAVDLSEVGVEFVLTVDQPSQVVHTESPESTFDVKLPADGEAMLAYGFNSPLAPLVGNPVRYQYFQALQADRTYYRTQEEFCSVLLPLLPLADVEQGFSLQAEALKAEAERRYLEP